MNILTLQATYGGLLHDIGKPVYRSGGQSGTHSALGSAFLKEIKPDEVWKPVLECIRYHHASELRAAKLPMDSPAYLVYFADNLAAAADRRKIEGEANSFSRSLPLYSVFSHLNGEHQGCTLPLKALSTEPLMPLKEGQVPDSSAYEHCVLELKDGLKAIDFGEEWLNSLLGLLDTRLSTVPSSTFTGESPDISLYDHVKITAAAAACISEYLLARNEHDLRSILFVKENEFRKESAFLLYTADFSGIQKFIYTVSTSKALASLRSRSFFLELLMEHYIDEILTACNVTRANLIYSGGGHCYLLLPNIPAVTEALTRLNRKFNDWLLDEFGTQLFLAHGWAECSCNDLTNTPAEQEPYSQIFRKATRAISLHKLHRYDSSQLRRINSREADETGRECPVCGRSDELTEEGRCRWCETFIRLSRKILTKDIYYVGPIENDSDFSLPGDRQNAWFSLTDEEDARRRLKNGDAVTRIYSKNRPFTGLAYSSPLYVGDYAASSTLEDLARQSNGISRLAVCRMDVDNLGHAFIAGFRKDGESDPVKRNHFVTLSRTATFSRQMSLFFKCFINSILAEPGEDGAPLAVTIVYSGGDDVFLIGAWDAIITAALRIRKKLRVFSCESLTISAGITMLKEHYPVRLAAEHAAELEDRAKNEPNKDSIALFDPGEDLTYDWETFERKVLGEKVALLRNFFSAKDQERGNAFLYQLLELLRNAKEDRIHLARYAYLLARMRPSSHAGQALYDEFARSMYRWALSSEDRTQLTAAICLYVYQERKGNE